MKIRSLSVSSLRRVFLSMAKLGNARLIDFNKQVTPEAGGEDMSAVDLPHELSRLRGFDVNLFWDYVGDEKISKFIFTANTELGFVLDGAFSIIDTLFSLTRLTVLYNGASLPLIKLADVSYDEFIGLLGVKRGDFEKMISFIKLHYRKLDVFLERRLRS